MTPRRPALRLPVLALLAALLGVTVLGTTAVERPGTVAEATAAPTIDLFLSPPLVQGPFQAGATIETFNTMPTGPHVSPTPLAMGTITSGSLTVAAAGVYGGAVTSSATPRTFGTGTGTNYAAPTSGGSNSAAIVLATPANYLGFYWTAGDSSNRVELYANGTLVAQFTTADIVAMIPTGTTVTAQDQSQYSTTNYYGNPRLALGTPPEAFAYVHIVAPITSLFDEIRVYSGGFEFDNLAVYTGTLDPTGLNGLIAVQRYVAADDSFETLVGSTVSDTVATNDTYGPGTTFSVLTQPSAGNVSMNSNGSFTYTAPSTATSTSFVYRLCRPNAGACEQATGTLSVIGATVTFEANDGTITNATQTAAPSTALRTNTFTRAGYTFAGWSTSTTGSAQYADGASFPFTTNTTLYAVWSVNAPTAQLPLVTAPVPTAPPATTTTVPVPTTTPSTPSTTAPPSTTPEPVPAADGALPILEPGASSVTSDGAAVPVEVFFDDDNTLTLRGQDFELNLAGECDGGCQARTDASGRQILEVESDGNAFVSGFGFMPGTLVHIWMFSEPTYLGALTVADDGTFQGSVYLQGIAPGQHTLQVNGTSFDGNDRSANLGVVVVDRTTDAAPTLPTTGGGNSAPQLVLVAFAMIMLGALARRRA